LRTPYVSFDEEWVYYRSLLSRQRWGTGSGYLQRSTLEQGKSSGYTPSRSPHANNRLRCVHHPPRSFQKGPLGTDRDGGVMEPRPLSAATGWPSRFYQHARDKSRVMSYAWISAQATHTLFVPGRTTAGTRETIDKSAPSKHRAQAIASVLLQGEGRIMFVRSNRIAGRCTAASDGASGFDSHSRRHQKLGVPIISAPTGTGGADDGFSTSFETPGSRRNLVIGALLNRTHEGSGTYVKLPPRRPTKACPQFGPA